MKQTRTTTWKLKYITKQLLYIVLKLSNRHHHMLTTSNDHTVFSPVSIDNLRSTTRPTQRRALIFSSKMSAEQFDTVIDV